MQSILRVDAPTARVQRPSARPTIPPDRFFASPETAPDESEVESETNPLFGGILARSVAPTSMDAPSAASLEDEVRSLTLGRRVAAIAAAFALGAGGAAVARGATPHHASHASTPLPLDVLAAAAAIEPAAPPPPPPCPTGMVPVPGATVALRDKPQREVNVAAYCIDALEVTVAQFASCTDAACKRPPTTNAWSGISWFEHSTFDPLCNARDAKSRGNHPMNCVDWKTAGAYCAARGARLPTEAEWELAARGTDGRRFPWGDDAPSATRMNGCGKECVAWGRAHWLPETPTYDSDDGFPTTAPVGSFPLGASPYGMKDAASNVFEWTSDAFGSVEKTTRGGVWNGAHADWAHPSLRWHAAAGARSYAIGFRCAQGSR
jgi:formylglycine-generating enzyme required for sulfatase activity